MMRIQVRRIRAFVTAACINPCDSKDYVDETDADKKKVLVNKESSDKVKADFDTVLADAKANAANIRKAITWFFETFGKEDCKEAGTNINSDLESDEAS